MYKLDEDNDAIAEDNDIFENANMFFNSSNQFFWLGVEEVLEGIFKFKKSNLLISLIA